MSAAGAVTAAVYTALNAAGLSVHDHVMEGVARPFVSFGGMSLRPWEGRGFSGFEVRVTLDFWSDALGRHQVLGLMETARGALFSGSLSVAGFHLVLAAEEMADVLREMDLRIFHGVMRLRLLVHGL